MTHLNLPPDDLHNPEPDTTAAWLLDHFGLPPEPDTVLRDDEREAIRKRVLATPPRPAGRARSTTGIVAGPPVALPADHPGGLWRIASVVAAAVLVLVVAATLGAVLRTDDAEQMPGAAATAALLPFAPGAVLASPTPVACTTGDTLLLAPEPAADTGPLAELPFPVAWYRDGTITVQRGGEVLREIDIGEAGTLRPTPVPGIVIARAEWVAQEPTRATLVNIITGETAAIGPYHRLTFSEGPYAFWASDGSFTRWSVTDLRTFETVDLSERFRTEPLMPWMPYSSSHTTSTDGTVLLAGTTSSNPTNQPATPATPFPADLPALEINHDAILIDGSLDDIRLVGPRSVTSGAITLSPDGATAAWLAPSERGGFRTLTMLDVASGETFGDRPIDATYSNSLLFSVDGQLLHATHGTTLETIVVHPENGMPLDIGPITLPDTAYRIVGASPDRTKLLLARTTSTAGEHSLWVDLATGEIRELTGTPGRLFLQGIPGVAGPIGRYVVLDDLETTVRMLDMTTGEVAISEDRDEGTGAMTISPDHSTLLIPREEGIALVNLATDRSTFHPAPDGAERILTFALASNGSCAAGSWHPGEGNVETVLLATGSDTEVALPPSAVGGWVPPDAAS